MKIQTKSVKKIERPKLCWLAYLKIEVAYLNVCSYEY